MSKFWRYDDREEKKVLEFLRNEPGSNMNIELEEKFAEKFGMKYAISINSGTSALHACMSAIDLQPGDEVIVPPLTFISTSWGAMYQGAKPVYVDVDPETFNIDPNKIEEKITSKTKAIIPVHIYGLPCDMDSIMNIAQKHNLKVIEDSAQCYLGRCNGKLAGTIGDMSIFSFERTKHITCGNGGIILTNNPELSLKARRFMKLGYSNLAANSSGNKPPKELLQSPEFERHVSIGLNYRLPEVCAAVMLPQLEKLDDFVQRRQMIAQDSLDAIASCPWLTPQKIPKNYENSYFSVAISLDTNKVSWADFRKEYIKESGDETPFYASWLLSYDEPIMKNLGFKTYCPVADTLQPRLIQLKTNMEKKEDSLRQAKLLRRTIKRFES